MELFRSGKVRTVYLLVLAAVLVTGMTLVPSGITVMASSPAASWTRLPIPAEGSAGRYVLAPGSDIRCLAAAPDGTLYAYGTGLTENLYRSENGGIGWSPVGAVTDTIVAIAVSPYDPALVYYATPSRVYRSVDSGESFLHLPFTGDWAGSGNRTITSLAAAWTEGHILAVGTRDTDAGEFGGVYMYTEYNYTPAWADISPPGSADVCAVAFSPDYYNDRQLAAVTTDETDTAVMFKVEGSEWNSLTGAAELHPGNLPGNSISAETAVLAFPANYHADMALGTSACYIGVGSGTGGGDVYRIDCQAAPGVSPATDLDAGMQCGLANVDIGGLVTVGDYPGPAMVAGDAAGNTVFNSTDGGEWWDVAWKFPSGEAVTACAVTGYPQANTLLVATAGAGSGLSASRDGGLTWNQVSFIDTSLDTIVDIIPAPGYNTDPVLFLLTFGGVHSLWRSGDGGTAWERILAGGMDGITALNLVALPPEYGDGCRTVFCAGECNGVLSIGESTDNGQFFRWRDTRDSGTGNSFSFDAWVVADAATLFIASYDGSDALVYRTNNRGFTYAQPVRLGTAPVSDIALSPRFDEDGAVVAGDSSGSVFYSGNAGVSFGLLPPDADAPPLSGSVAVVFDTDFTDNRVVYAAGDDADDGIYRFRVDTGTYWEQVDTSLPGGSMIVSLAAAGGRLYAANALADGGMERCLGPHATGCFCDTVTRGLEDGASLGGVWVSGDTVWAIDSAGQRLLRLDDTLCCPVVPISPADGVGGVGSMVENAVKNVWLEWQVQEGATVYEWQCDDERGFTGIATGLQGTTTGCSLRLPDLEPAMTYYWRVRASSPFHSPWSAVSSFVTGLNTEAVILKPENPVPGSADIPLKPMFRWTALVGAEGYELLVADDIGFSSPVVIRSGEFSLPGNAWQCDVTLDGASMYYWKVRAVTAGTFSAWSATGIFTTGYAPDQQPLPSSIETIPAGDAQPYTPETGTPAVAALQTVTVTKSAPAGVPDQTGGIPAWVLYLIGGLMAIITLALVVLLVTVLKLRVR